MINQETVQPLSSDRSLQINTFDYLELWVGNAKQAAYYFVSVFGFTPVAFAGLETGVRDRVSYVLVQRQICLVVTGALHPTSPISVHVAKHGDGVHDIAFQVDDASATYREATRRGARGVLEPVETTDELGRLVKASIATYGDTIHTFVQRSAYAGVFAPGFQPLPADYFGVPSPTGVAAIDHIVGNVELGKMKDWVEIYAATLGFEQFQEFTGDDITTEYSALMSKVMQNGSGRIKLPINEPAKGRRKSQIDEYLEFYQGPGVQHIALITGNILETVAHLRARGLQFLKVPPAYYNDLEQRVGTLPVDLDHLRENAILVDRDEEGYLLQIFTAPIVDRPTLFLEIIQRLGSRGFGKGNFRALFEAIEREQERRGNL